MWRIDCAIEEAERSIRNQLNTGLGERKLHRKNKSRQKWVNVEYIRKQDR